MHWHSRKSTFSLDLEIGPLHEQIKGAWRSFVSALLTSDSIYIEVRTSNQGKNEVRTSKFLHLG